MFVEEIVEVVYTDTEKLAMYEYVTNMLLTDVIDLDKDPRIEEWSTSDK